MHSKFIINTKIRYKKTEATYSLPSAVHDTHVCLEYRLVRKLGEGTFSEVLKAESVKTR